MKWTPCLFRFFYIILVTANAQLFRKIVPRPLFESECFPQRVDLSSYPQRLVVCASTCANTNRCWSFCLQNELCLMYDARITLREDPPPPPDSDMCYSSWSLGPRSIIVQSATASSQMSSRPLSTPISAANGYFCNSLNTCYVSVYTSGSWWNGDLGKVFAIKEIWVQTRKSYFLNVQARVGNTSVIADQTIIGETLSQVDEAKYLASNPILGRYVSLRSLSGSFYFVLCDVKIIPALELWNVSLLEYRNKDMKDFCLLYHADDLALVVTGDGYLFNKAQWALNRLSQECGRLKLKISTSKRTRKQRSYLILQGDSLPWQPTYQYLGI
ncbi:uncharacterized protein LOC143028923 [Oratosquilla oratoria]|uniref:uncharacterized protein LOC143028923 n=1 Tax=Oratosquilla oratoria TaxID=337810 RepID=UPI003F76CEEC